MHDPVVLISAVCGDIGFSAARALKSSAGKIIGCDINPIFPGWIDDLVDCFEEVPPANAKLDYIDAINHLIHKHGVDCFLPISEAEIEVVNTDKNKFDIEPDKILINKPLIIDTFLDKFKTNEFLNKMDIAVPETIPFATYGNEFHFPLVVKTRRGCGAKRNWKVMDQAELDRLRAEDDGSLIVQQHIGSSDGEYTTGVFSDGRETASITFRRKLGYGGLSVEISFEEIPFLEEMARRVAAQCGLQGSINLQTRRVGDLYMPFEINPRLSSTLLFRKKFGFDDAVWWLKLNNNEQFEYNKRYNRGSAIRYLTEKFHDLQEC